MQRRAAASQRGFTLLEVLVALSVVAVALAALLKGVNSSAVNAAYLRDRTLAHWVAMNVVAESQLQPEQAAAGSDRRGEEEMGGRYWRWRARTAATFDEAILRLEVDVWPADADSGDVLAHLVAFLPRANNGKAL